MTLIHATIYNDIYSCYDIYSCSPPFSGRMLIQFYVYEHSSLKYIAYKVYYDLKNYLSYKLKILSLFLCTTCVLLFVLSVIETLFLESIFTTSYGPLY